MNSPTVQRFLAANAKSPVVSGYAREPNPNRPAKGAVYTLKDGQQFRFSAKECGQFTPIWDLPA